jgi:hypothetical protein
MIYLEMHSGWAESQNHPANIATKTDIQHIPLNLKLMAEKIFMFDKHGTYYYKDRYADNYQHTDEERLVVALSSVLV